LSQKDLKRERKVWQDKESATKRQLSQLSAEVRELKAKLHQSSELHDAYKQHVESKEAARSTETSGWDMRKQALLSEHQLELKRASGAQSSRISQLESELERVKAELEHSNAQVQQLKEQLHEDGGSYSTRHEQKKEAPSSLLGSFKATIPEVDITISASTSSDSQPQTTENTSDEAAF